MRPLCLEHIGIFQEGTLSRTDISLIGLGGCFRYNKVCKKKFITTNNYHENEEGYISTKFLIDLFILLSKLLKVNQHIIKMHFCTVAEKCKILSSAKKVFSSCLSNSKTVCFLMIGFVLHVMHLAMSLLIIECCIDALSLIVL